MATQTGERRRRRTPQEAEREILDAAEAFLRSRPFRDLTIDEVMDGTGLSRPSFYVYFRDRHHLALALLDAVRDEVFEFAEPWFEGRGDGPAEMRAGLRGAVAVYERHGRLMRAIVDAATEDAEVEEAYRALVEGFVELTARQIEREVAAGASTVADPQNTACALVWMNERYFTDKLGRGAAGDPDAIADTVSAIWSATIYGR